MLNLSRERCGRGRGPRRTLVGALVGATSFVVLPVALAWACAPSTGAIAFDKEPAAYNGGEVVKVIGDGFAKDNPVDMMMQPPSGPAVEVASGTSTNSRGYFEASFTVPADAAPGAYAVQATTDPSNAGHGGQTQPTSATDTFEVLAPPTSAPPPTTPVPAVPAPVDPATKPDRARQLAQARRRRAASRSRAVARCKRTHRAKKGSTTRRKKAMKRKRSACVRRARGK